MVSTPFRKVVCALSGGVDSSVAALLLKKKGFNVIGIYMRNWDTRDEFGVCRADEEMADAARISKLIGIPFYEVNLVKEYWNHVFSEMLNAYENGFTPNPDILCNKHIKFKHFIDLATSRFQADAVATGHYASSSFGPYLEHFSPNTNASLLQAQDQNKDQTFFLSQIPQEALRRTMFPLAQLTKPAVRQLASEAGLDWVARKRESTGMCFIGKRNFKNFIGQYAMPKPGNFVDFRTGKVVGKHQGIHLYTLGERAHIKRGRGPPPYFIYKKCLQTQNIYVVAGTNHPLLYGSSFLTTPPYWISGKSPLSPTEHEQGKFTCGFRFQHRFPIIPCQITILPNGLKVHLDDPQRALTPGQFAVFYKDGECLGSSQIITVDMDQKEQQFCHAELAFS